MSGDHDEGDFEEDNLVYSFGDEEIDGEILALQQNRIKNNFNPELLEKNIERSLEEEAMKKNRVSGDTLLTESKEGRVFKGYGNLSISATDLQNDRGKKAIEKDVSKEGGFLNLKRLEEVESKNKELLKVLTLLESKYKNLEDAHSDLAKLLAITCQRVADLEKLINTKEKRTVRDHNILAHQLVDYLGDKVSKKSDLLRASLDYKEIKAYFHFKQDVEAYRLMERTANLFGDKVFISNSKNSKMRLVARDAFADEIRKFGKVVR